MKCKFCGAKLADGSVYCDACGNSLIDMSDDDTKQETAASEPVDENSDSQESNEKGESFSFPSIKSKKPLLFLILGGILLLLILVAVLFFTFKASFLRVFMGKEDYAKSVLMNTISDAVSEADVIESASNSLNSAFVSVSDEYDSEEAYLVMLAMANSAAGVDGISLSAGVDIRPTMSVYKGIDDVMSENDMNINAETLMALMQKLNSFTLTATERTSTEDYQFAITYGEEKSPLFNATVFYGADGKIYITFPGATKSALVAHGPALPAVAPSEAVEIDMKQIDELEKQLEVVFDEYYKEAEVIVQKDSIKIGDAEFEGLCSEIIFESATMYDMLNAMIDVLADNTYLCGLLESNIEEFVYEDDFISELKNSIEGMDETGVEFCFRGYVTPSNKLAGVEFSVDDDANEIIVSALDTSANFAVCLEAKGDQENVEVMLVAEKTDETSGTAEFVVKAGEDADVTFDIEYSDFGKHKAFGEESFVGTFKLLINADMIESIIDEEFGDETFKIGNEEYTLRSVFENAAVIVKVSPNGKGIRYDLAYECETLGYYGVYVAAVPAGKKVASGKFEGNKAIDIDDIAKENGIEFVEKVTMYYAENLLKDEVIGTALDDIGLGDPDDLIEALTGGYDIDEYIERFYGTENAAYTVMPHTW